MHLASQSGCGHSVLLALKKGGSINSRCHRGFSPMTWALIGSDGVDNEAAGVLMSSAKAHVEVVKQQKNENSPLLDEMMQGTGM
jgi:hypothetical protein